MTSSFTSFPWKSFSVRMVLPTMMTIIMFVCLIFFIIIPTIENNILKRKREMIRELTNSAWNILARFEASEQIGVPQTVAQREAIEQILNLHYGQEMKDYFWIIDMHPRMVIHPYRSDLTGRDLSDYRDPEGKLIFVAMVNIVKERGSGYLTYQWQWKDDKNRIAPKISYVKHFAPWGWIIGTGVYTDDIDIEVKEFTSRVLQFSLLILLLITLLMGVILTVSYQAHKRTAVAEEELKKTLSSLAISERIASLGRLSAMVAHEINNPLSGILSYAKLSMKYLSNCAQDPGLIASTKENLSVIAGEATRCGDIVRNLLLFAKRTMVEVEEFHLNEIVDISIKVIDHSAQMKSIELVAQLGEGNDVLQCDAGSIQQILVSLIVNAIEASSEHNKIIIKTDCGDAETVTLKVIDNGNGIPEDIIPRIFDPFFSTKESNKSLGLGLSAVYGIVEHHGGSIEVKSEVGIGTEFSITLPRVLQAATRSKPQ